MAGAPRPSQCRSTLQRLVRRIGACSCLCITVWWQADWSGSCWYSVNTTLIYNGNLVASRITSSCQVIYGEQAKRRGMTLSVGCGQSSAWRRSQCPLKHYPACCVEKAETVLWCVVRSAAVRLGSQHRRGLWPGAGGQGRPRPLCRHGARFSSHVLPPRTDSYLSRHLDGSNFCAGWSLWVIPSAILWTKVHLCAWLTMSMLLQHLKAVIMLRTATL